MKVTVYELLGMIKDGKAPKKIRYIDKIFNYDKLHADYVFMETYGESNTREYLTDWIGLSKYGLTDEVEIIEEEKKIPEKICTNRIINTKDILEFEMIQNKINAEYTYAINSIVDYLKSKGE